MGLSYGFPLVVFHASHVYTGAVCKRAVDGALGGARIPRVVHMSTTSSQAVVSGLQAFKSRISSLPNVKKFLQPGSQRKLPVDAKQIEEARKIFKF